ncbi:hypothetical protein D3C72_630670 [compost metagenome]
MEATSPLASRQTTTIQGRPGPGGRLRVRVVAARSSTRPALAATTRSAPSLGSPWMCQAPPWRSSVASLQRWPALKSARNPASEPGSTAMPSARKRPSGAQPTPVTARRRSAVQTACTVMAFSVSVPVLSRQTVVTPPRASSAPKRLSKRPWRVSRRAPAASASVATTGRPSGMAAIASTTVTSSSWPIGRPCSHPRARITPATAETRPTRVLPRASSRAVMGASGRMPVVIKRPNRPTSVRGPVATTIMVPVPPVTMAPAKTSLRRSPRASPAESGSASATLPTGTDSPVKSDSSACKGPATSRPSAGTRSPGSSSTTSPGTSWSALRSSTRPSRRTRARVAASSAKAAISRSARSSIASPMAVFTTSTATMARPSATSPSRNEIADAAMSSTTMKFVT